MKARRIVGKTIKRVVQVRFPGHCHVNWSLEGIQFTDGTWLRFVTLEHPEGDDYGLCAVYPGCAPEEED
jgi:hypothetical protein